MSTIATTIRSVGANSVTFETVAFAAADDITYAALKADILTYADAPARKHKITNLRNGQLLTFLSGTYASSAAAMTAFAEAGGIIAVTPGAAATTDVASLKVAQASFISLLGSIAGGSIIRISLAASITE